jgi:hypothetical protein
MQYILNQSEFDEYMLLKENSIENQEKEDNQMLEDMIAMLKQSRIERIDRMSTMRSEFHITIDESCLQESMKNLLLTLTNVPRYA